MAMSEDSGNDSDVSVSNSNIITQSEQDKLPTKRTTNTMKEDQQFIYDKDFCKLICIGSNLNDIPLSILHEYSLKAKVNDEEEKYFDRILICFCI